MSIFFRPSDITTRICTVTNKTKGGSAFGICPDNEQVFISPKIVDATRIEVGDLLTAYCIDNHRDPENESRFAVRWRAIRVTLQERFSPSALVAPVAAPVALPEALEARIMRLMKQDRAWTTVQMAEELGERVVDIVNCVQYRSRKGAVATVKVYKSTDQQNPSHIWYARDVDLIKDLIDEVLLE